ncbi:LCP family protein [Terrabacter sp. C0L_2]|uniref:LCP family protein n=1 Tax=Terrabacter sp. C0L_2 TaxID=3108389 RepID=UPI002ECFE95B|nr:LCP family protein [Terrabacter sp. C0L_2]
MAADGPRWRRALALTALGTLVPGAGLTRARNRWLGRLGWLMVAATLVVLGTVAYAVWTRGFSSAVLDVVSRPEALRPAAFVIAAWGFLWCASILLTAVQVRPRPGGRLGAVLLGAFAAVMAGSVGAGTVVAVDYALITRDTVSAVFSAPPTQPGVGARVSEGADPWAAQARVNLLLLGSDAGSDRTGIRTDSMIVASIDTRSGRTTLVSMPRNLLDAPLAPGSPLRARYPSGRFGAPDRTCAQNAPGETGQCQLTNLYGEAEAYALDHPGAYAKAIVPGREEVRGSVQQIVGLPIDHVVVIDLRGFSLLVDAMGGIDVNVKDAGTGGPLPIGGHVTADNRVVGVKEWFRAGRQHLDGWHALWYARSRAADSDTYRQARQRCVVQAIVEQADPAAMVRQYPRLARIARDNIYTDIPAASLPAFVELVERAQRARLNSVSLTLDDGIKPWAPDYARIRALVRRGIAAPTPAKAATPSTTPTPGRPAAPPRRPPATPSPTTTPYAQC